MQNMSDFCERYSWILNKVGMGIETFDTWYKSDDKKNACGYRNTSVGKMGF